MSKCDCCNNDNTTYTAPNSNVCVCISCMWKMFEENIGVNLLKEVKILRERNSNLETENNKLRNVLCGKPF